MWTLDPLCALLLPKILLDPRPVWKPPPPPSVGAADKETIGVD